MKKDYNRDVMSDMPVEASFAPSVETVKSKSASKPKINAIGTQKRTATTKTSSSNKGATKSNTTKTTSSTKSGQSKTVKSSPGDVQDASHKKIRTKLVNTADEISDLEKLNEENIKAYRFKAKRNKVVIVILAVLLAISIASIITFLVISKLKTNCNFYIHGDVKAEFVINGEKLDEFRSPANLQGNRILEFELKIKITSSGKYNIKYIPKCYQKGVLMNNTLVYEANLSLFYEGGDGFYYSKAPISGDQTITLCGGIILDYDYENSLNVDNFRLDFDVYFEKV